jgi:hypothetical protein
MFSSFIHSLQITLYHCSLWLNSIPLWYIRVFFIHSSVPGHLEWFHNLATVNCTTISTDVQVSLSYTDLCFLRYIPRSGITVSYGISTFRFLRNLSTDFPSGCTNLTSRFWFKRIYGFLMTYFCCCCSDQANFPSNQAKYEYKWKDISTKLCSESFIS